MTLPPMTSGAERLGYLLLTAQSEGELDELTERALAALDIEIAAEPARVRGVACDADLRTRELRSCVRLNSPSMSVGKAE